MPFVDLNTFDEHFATLRLLSPFSRTISEQAGFANHTPPIFAFVIYLTCIRGRSGQKPESNLHPAVTRPVPPDALWRSERHSAVMLAEAGAPHPLFWWSCWPGGRPPQFHALVPLGSYFLFLQEQIKDIIIIWRSSSQMTPAL